VRDRVLSTRFPKRNNIAYEAPKKRRRGRVKSVSSHEAEQKAAAENEKWEHEHGLKVADIYAFTGMHHIFTHHAKAVTRLAFAHNEKGILAMASVDGIISIGNLFDSDPNRSLKILRDHIMAVTDLSWSHNNSILSSCSLDGHLRIWNPQTATCTHSVDLGSPALCCSFVPTSNQWVLVGDKMGQLFLVDANTGQIVSHVQLNGTVTAIGFHVSYPEITAYVGCQTGDLYWVKLLQGEGGASCSIEVTEHVKLGNTSITSLLFRAQMTGSWNMPSLLISQIRSPTRLYKISKDESSAKEQLELYAEFPPAPKKSFVRSTMCPLIPARNNVCLVSGSESGTVYIYGVRPPFKQASQHNLQVGWMVNQFAGHAGVIYDVQWNADESLLASADQDGMVIIWKRVSVKSPTANFTSGPAQTLTKSSHVTSPGAAPKKRPPPHHVNSPSRRDLVENPLLATSSLPSTPSKPIIVRADVNSPSVTSSPARPGAVKGAAPPRSQTMPPPAAKQPAAVRPAAPSQPKAPTSAASAPGTPTRPSAVQSQTVPPPARSSPAPDTVRVPTASSSASVVSLPRAVSSGVRIPSAATPAPVSAAPTSSTTSENSEDIL
jgi:WD repeat-containing protein 13